MACLLILDDDEISARLAARMLQTGGHVVHTAANSSTAWTRINESPIDLLVLDSELDGEHGWEFLERIREDVLVKLLPVIVFSSISRRDVVQRYLSLGVQGMLVKPSTAERLNQEAERLTRVSWRKKLFESEDSVQARTGLMPAEVTQLYVDAARELESALPELRPLGEDPATPSARARLAALRSCVINIGFFGLKAVVEQMLEAVDKGDAARVRRLIDRIPAALALLCAQAGVEPSQELPVLAGAAAPGGEPASGGEPAASS